jgi:hypothetical protein
LARRTYSDHVLQLARRGAEARFQELVSELKLLTNAFPHLKDSFDSDELPIRFLLRRGRDKAAASPARKRTPSWTPAARKAAAERMKAYWAQRKAGRKK